MTTYLTRAEAARYARVSTRTIDRWRQDGVLTTHRAGPKKILIDLDELVTAEKRAGSD